MSTTASPGVSRGVSPFSYVFWDWKGTLSRKIEYEEGQKLTQQVSSLYAQHPDVFAKARVAADSPSAASPPPGAAGAAVDTAAAPVAGTAVATATPADADADADAAPAPTPAGPALAASGLPSGLLAADADADSEPVSLPQLLALYAAQRNHLISTAGKVRYNSRQISEHVLGALGIDDAASVDRVHATFVMSANQMGLYPDALHVLETLRAAGVPMGLIRNSSIPGPQMRAIVAQFGCDHCFDTVAMSGECGHAKPDRRMFEYAARLAGVADVPPKQLVFIGNEADCDIAGGAAMGWTTILVRHTERTSNGLADFEVDTLSELLDILLPPVAVADKAAV